MAASTIYRTGTVRVLSFSLDDRKYERIYGWCVTGAPIKDRTQSKVHGAVLDKLEGIGQVKPPVDEKTGQPREFLRDEIRFYVTVMGGRVVLEEAEYELVVERVTAAIAGVHPSLSRDYEKTLSWLESLPKLDAAAVESGERITDGSGVAGH